MPDAATRVRGAGRAAPAVRFGHRRRPPPDPDHRPPTRPSATTRHTRRIHPCTTSTTRDLTLAGVALRVGIVALALGTAYIHSTLGGLLFTLNAVGYARRRGRDDRADLALAIRFRWVVRLGLMGYALTTIAGWAIQGPYYSTAYVAKAIEVALIALVAIDFVRADGNPVGSSAARSAAGSRGSASAGPTAPRRPDVPTTVPGAGRLRRRPTSSQPRGTDP